MGDVYKEQIVKKKPTTKDMLIRVGVIVAVVLLFFIVGSIQFLQAFLIFIMAAVIFAAFFLFSYLKVEYEYILTNGVLDIDAIYNKSRRKRLFSGDLREIEVMAHLEDKMHTGDFKSAQETKDYTSGVHGKNTYAFLTRYKGKNTKVIIEPNEAMMQALGAVIPKRKFFKY